MDDDDVNIIPYETSPTLTVKQAVMYMLGYRGEFTFHISDTEYMTFDIHTYLYNLQEEADCAAGNASAELKLLKRNENASAEEIKEAEQKVETTQAELEEANNLPKVAEQYRLMINHEISKVRLGKRSPLVIDEDQSAGGSLRIITASFQAWLDGIDLGDDNEDLIPVDLPLDEDAYDKALSRKSAVSLYVTLGLLISLYAESTGGDFDSGQKPNVIKIAEKISEYAKDLNGGYPLDWQKTSSIKKRIEKALSALDSYI